MVWSGSLALKSVQNDPSTVNTTPKSDCVIICVICVYMCNCNVRVIVIVKTAPVVLGRGLFFLGIFFSGEIVG